MENRTDNDLLYLCLKFAKTEDRAKSVMNGKLYGNDPEYFRNREKETGERGQGDANELVLVQEGFNLAFISDGKPFFKSQNATAKIRYREDDTKTMVSFIGLSLNDLEFHGYENGQEVYKLPFTDEDYEYFSSTFGAHCVVIHGPSLQDMLKKYEETTGIKVTFGKVKYYPKNSMERAERFASLTDDRFFLKDSEFAAQREYRAFFDMNLPENHIVNIGSLRHCSTYLEIKDLKKYKYASDSLTKMHNMDKH